jgi:hypothetical protein
MNLQKGDNILIEQKFMKWQVYFAYPAMNKYVLMIPMAAPQNPRHTIQLLRVE